MSELGQMARAGTVEITHDGERYQVCLRREYFGSTYGPGETLHAAIVDCWRAFNGRG